MISIHAPAKGATASTTPSGISAKNFNPRSREGSDRDVVVLFVVLLYFNPRSREGSDCQLLATCNAQKSFQSTLPRRERPD